MTHRTRAQERADEIDVSPSRLVAEIERLTGELDAAKRQSDEYLALLQRERELGLAGEDLIRKVLTIADDFDRAIDARPAELRNNAWAEGIAAIDRKLQALLDSEGVKRIEASPGRAFDPREHDAIANVSATGRGDGEIVEEVRRGYRLRDRVLRPALVAVAAGSKGDSPATGESPTSTTDETQSTERNETQND